MEVKLITPGKTDGLYRIWDGNSLMVERTNIDLSGSENLLLNEVMLDCYWNDGSPEAQNRFFDNFIISTERIGPFLHKTRAINIEHFEKKIINDEKISP